MDWKALAGPLTDAGLTLLGSAIGGPAGGIATTIGRELARELGVSTPRQVEEVIRTNPQAVETLHQYEAMHAEELALLAGEQTHMSEILAREDAGTFFQWGWRPATMWLIGVMWMWSIIVVPTLNALAGTAVPLPPFDMLFAFTGLFLSLYMGGHTVLRALDKRGMR